MSAAFGVTPFLKSGAVKDAPESVHTVSGLNRKTFKLVGLPPIMAACESDHGRRRGATPGGETVDWYAETPYGGEAVIVNVCEDRPSEPS